MSLPLWIFAAAAARRSRPGGLYVLPKISAAGVALADPIYDHAKIALVDEIVRAGVPPANRFPRHRGRQPRRHRLLLLLAVRRRPIGFGHGRERVGWGRRSRHLVHGLRLAGLDVRPCVPSLRRPSGKVPCSMLDGGVRRITPPGARGAVRAGPDRCGAGGMGAALPAGCSKQVGAPITSPRPRPWCCRSC